jgi:hypothetical protein
MSTAGGARKQGGAELPGNGHAAAAERRPPAARRPGDGAVLITGGAGFIGTNLAARLAGDGHDVLILDNLSRPGVERNLQWLCHQHAERVRVLRADVRDAGQVQRAVRRAQQVFHFAAQVAVTSSLIDPRFDCDVNVLGTLNVLEGHPPHAGAAPAGLHVDEQGVRQPGGRAAAGDADALRAGGRQRAAARH